MPSAFQLFGELKADTKEFEAAMHRAEKELNQTGKAIEKQEQKAKELGQTSATVARQYEKLTDKVKESRDKLTQTASAFEKGEASAKQMGSALQRTAKDTASLNSRLKDSGARLDDFASKGRSLFNSFTSKVGLGVGIGNIATEAARAFGRFAKEGREAYATLDNLVRFTTTLDRSFQNTNTIKQLTRDFRELSTQIPQSAENIAKASFTVKSAYADLSPTQLTAYLREMGEAASGSNATIDEHADNVIALAKAYGIAAKDLPKFSALIATTFGDALASDTEVGTGFNKILTSARNLKQPLEEVTAAMAAINSTSSDAAKNTTNLQNVYAKLADPKVTEGLKKVFNIEAFDAEGQFRGLNSIVNELAESFDGLTDKERTEKLGKVFKDLQAREGILQLINAIDTYNQRLKEGGDIDAYGAKNKVMLEGASASWAKFTNSLEGYQAKIGESMSNVFEGFNRHDSSFDNILSGLQEFGAEVGLLASKIAEGVAKIFVELETGARGFFTDTAVERENSIKAIEDYFGGIRDGIETQRDKDRAGILERNKQYYQQVLVDPLATDQQKTKAKEKIKGFQDVIEAELKQKQNISWGGLSLSFDKALSQVPAKAEGWATKIANSFTSAMAQNIANKKGEVNKATENAFPKDGSRYSVFGAIIAGGFVGGIISGINDGRDRVGAAVSSLINEGFKRGQATQEAHSPSKRAFRELGVPFAQGVELGILSRIPNVADAASDFVHAAFIGADKMVKGLLKGIKTGKGDKDGIELLKSLVGELSSVNVKGKEQETILELLADKYDKLNSKIKEKIIAAAKELDIIEKTKIGYEKVSDALQNLFEKVLPEKTELQKVADIFKDPANLSGIKAVADGIGYTTDKLRNLFDLLASDDAKRIKELEGIGTGRSGIDFTGAGIGIHVPEDLLDITKPDGFPPPPIDPWNNFFDALRRKFKELKDTAISTKEAMGEAFLDFTFGIGDAFAQAASEWDGTLKGFFSSVLSALRQTVQQIISELIRVMITKLVLNIAGSLIGSLGGIFSGGFPGSGTTAHEGGHSGGLGGFSSFTGGGGGSSFAGAFAGGGGGSSFAPAQTTNNVKNNYSLNMNVPPGTSQQQQQSIRQQGQQFLVMLKKLEQQNK